MKMPIHEDTTSTVASLVYLIRHWSYLHTSI